MKTTRRPIERMPHLRLRIGAVACAGALSLMCLPTSAWANAGTTQVTVEADPSSVIEYDVPTELPFYVAADGTLTGPTPSACQIVNKSVFGIHVTEVSVTPADGWNIVSSAEVGSGINSIDFQFGPIKQIDALSAINQVDVSSDASFNMGYAGSGKETVSIDSSGDVARLTHDITKPIPVATISWTVAAGSASGVAAEEPEETDDAPQATQEEQPLDDSQPSAGDVQPADDADGQEPSGAPSETVTS